MQSKTFFKMNNKILWSLMLLFQFQLMLAQNDFNNPDNNGKKNGLWKGFYPDSKRLRFEGNFEHGTETGIFRFFDNSDANTLIATRTFTKNRTVATNVFFDSKGNIMSQGSTLNKLNEGIWTYFHSASKDIKMIENYHNGKLSGVKKVFYKKNILAEESRYINDVKNGLSKIYTDKGIIMEEAYFKNGIYEGLAIFREPSGKIASKGYFVDGGKKGKWQFFENGKLKKEIMMPEKIKVRKPEEKKE